MLLHIKIEKEGSRKGERKEKRGSRLKEKILQWSKGEFWRNTNRFFNTYYFSRFFFIKRETRTIVRDLLPHPLISDNTKVVLQSGSVEIGQVGSCSAGFFG